MTTSNTTTVTTATTAITQLTKSQCSQRINTLISSTDNTSLQSLVTSVLYNALVHSSTNAKSIEKLLASKAATFKVTVGTTTKTLGLYIRALAPFVTTDDTLAYCSTKGAKLCSKLEIAYKLTTFEDFSNALIAFHSIEAVEKAAVFKAYNSKTMLTKALELTSVDLALQIETFEATLQALTKIQKDNRTLALATNKAA